MKNEKIDGDLMRKISHREFEEIYLGGDTRMKNENFIQVGGSAQTACSKCGKLYSPAIEGHFCEKITETSNAEVVGKASGCERCERLEKKIVELKAELESEKRKARGRQIGRGGLF